ncbi:hypothetical protein [Lyngbya confervoides]|uniref:Uncharacterized protein n=1 Tax=Lyngbya confervoides BDU141951 TaxID=1574623 RepID=A0ABD4T903_9CYAN|nr:hypothetical protein [Lyngbya confervoides]MCM1985091.1 hypothetical protein [Lyngbya confervoides BDU141951]
MTNPRVIVGDLFPEELQMIRDRLPEHLQDLGADHMQTLASIAEAWHLEPLPAGYAPEMVDVYVEEQEDPILSYEHWEMSVASPEFFPEKFTVLALEVDSVLRYAQIRGQEVFNRLGNVELPEDFAFAAA